MEVKKRNRRPKLTLEKIRQEFEKEGLTLLEKEYRGTKQMLKYRCKCKKTRYICYNNFYRGTRCKLCYLQQFANPERDQKYILKIQTRELHFTVTDAARIIGVNYDEFRNAILDGLLPAPTHRIPGSIKFHFNEADIEQIREMIEIEEAPRPKPKKKVAVQKAVRAMKQTLPEFIVLP